MPSITLKDVPPGLLEALREAAERDRRSLTQQVYVLLERALSTPERSQEVRDQVEAWRRLAGSWQSAQSFEEEVASLVEARSGGRDVAL